MTAVVANCTAMPFATSIFAPPVACDGDAAAP